MKGKHLKSEAAKQRSKWYGTAKWKRLRKLVLAVHPICHICGVAPATQADHVQHRPDNSTFWDTANLRGACADCNNREGARERHRRGSAAMGGGWSERKGRGASTAEGSMKHNFLHFKRRSHPLDAASIAAKLIGRSDQ